MKRFLSLFVAGLFCCALLFAEEAAQEEQSPQEKAKADYQKVQLAAAEKYGKALDSESEKATKAGNLDLLNEIEAAKKAISGAEINPTDKKWEKNKALAVAAKNFNDELSKANKSYVAALEKVVVELTKQKKIEEAKEVKKLVEELKVEEVKRVIVGEWIKTKDKSVWNFRDDFTWVCKDFDGTWSFDGNQIQFKPKTGGWVGQITIIDRTTIKDTVSEFRKLIR